MNRHISVFICVFTLAATAKVAAIDPNRLNAKHEHDYEHEQEYGKKQKYTCPMHPEVVTDHPGNCPKCGMKLVPKTEKKRSTSNSEGSRAGVQRPTPNHPSHETRQHAME